MEGRRGPRIAGSGNGHKRHRYRPAARVGTAPLARAVHLAVVLLQLLACAEARAARAALVLTLLRRHRCLTSFPRGVLPLSGSTGTYESLKSSITGPGGHDL